MSQVIHLEAVDGQVLPLLDHHHLEDLLLLLGDVPLSLNQLLSHGVESSVGEVVPGQKISLPESAMLHGPAWPAAQPEVVGEEGHLAEVVEVVAAGHESPELSLNKAVNCVSVCWTLAAAAAQEQKEAAAATSLWGKHGQSAAVNRK